MPVTDAFPCWRKRRPTFPGVVVLHTPAEVAAARLEADIEQQRRDELPPGFAANVRLYLDNLPTVAEAPGEDPPCDGSA